jgi:hypothetical protein
MATHIFDGPSATLTVLENARVLDVVSCSDGEFLVISAAATGHVSLAPVQDLEREKRGLAARARIELSNTDHVEYRVATPERTPSPAWLAWREQLREVVRGVRMEIPEEPQRYTDAPTAPLMPADLAALALPDESLADLKVRLLTELTRLRSMAVGRLDMTDAERAMLTTLEGQVAQQWFSS